MAAFQVFLKSWNQRKVGWVGDENHVAFGQKFPGKRGSVRRRIVVVQQPVLLSPKQSLCTFSLSRCKTS
jgi:hypothetical protein